jgi:hypothetical protein
MFEEITGKAPTEPELQQAAEFVEKQATEADPEEVAREVEATFAVPEAQTLIAAARKQVASMVARANPKLVGGIALIIAAWLTVNFLAPAMALQFDAEVAGGLFVLVLASIVNLKSN